MQEHGLARGADMLADSVVGSLVPLLGALRCLCSSSLHLVSVVTSMRAGADTGQNACRGPVCCA